MTAYEGSPQDEGYSEDPLTIGSSATLPPWVESMSAVERTGTLRRQNDTETVEREADNGRICDEHHFPPTYFPSCGHCQQITTSSLHQLLQVSASGGMLESSWFPRPSISDQHGPGFARMDGVGYGQEVVGTIIYTRRLT